MTASGLIYAGAGHRNRAGSETCSACGDLSSGQFVNEWIKPTFVDYDKLKPGSIICDACEFCFTDRNPDLTRLTAKDKLQRMRNYSHFVVSGVWTPVSKGDKPRMIELLQKSPQLAVIADSGQKHLVFRACPGWWQFEELAIRPDIGALIAMIDDMRSLLATFAKAEIASARYATYRIAKCGLAAWRDTETRLKPKRGSALFALALFLAQREETDGIADDCRQAAEPAMEGDRHGVQAPLFT